MAPRRPADPVRSGFAFTLSFLLLLMAVSALALTRVRELKPLDTLWPQHWAYFADENVRQIMLPYRMARGELTPLAIRNGSVESWAGLSRKSHAQLAEIAYLAGQVPEGQWSPCADRPLLECGRQAMAGPPVPVDNPVVLPTICGSVLLSIEKAAPGRSPTGAPLAPQLVVALSVRCERG